MAVVLVDPNFHDKDDIELILSLSNSDVESWRDLGLCRGLFHIYDLPDSEMSRKKRFAANQERVRLARPICFECPVFQKCWDDAYDNIDNTEGVIRAGALLHSSVVKQRIKRLVLAHDLYVQYHERKHKHGRANRDADKRAGKGGGT